MNRKISPASLQASFIIIIFSLYIYISWFRIELGISHCIDVIAFFSKLKSGVVLLPFFGFLLSSCHLNYKSFYFMECLPVWVSLIFSHDKIMVNNFDKNSTQMIHYIGNYRFFFWFPYGDINFNHLLLHFWNVNLLFF